MIFTSTRWVLLYLMCMSCLLVAQNLDVAPLYYFQDRRTSLGDVSASFINVAVYPLTVLEPMSELSISYIKKDTLLRRKAFQNAISVGVGMTLSTILKYSIDRPRPYETFLDLSAMNLEYTPSFPSGHTTAAFITATNLSLSFRKWYVIVPAYSYAAFVGFTRIYSGVHYTSDVFCGALCGAGSSLLTHYLYKKIQGRRKKQLQP